jgi:hypothetical protein
VPASGSPPAPASGDGARDFLSPKRSPISAAPAAAVSAASHCPLSQTKNFLPGLAISTAESAFLGESSHAAATARR